MDFSATSMLDVVTAVQAIDNVDAARDFFTAYVNWLRVNGRSQEEATDIARENIGWCYGEGLSPERIRMWRAATGAEHPAGKIEEMTTQEIFDAGKRWGEASRGKG